MTPLRMAIDTVAGLARSGFPRPPTIRTEVQRALDTMPDGLSSAIMDEEEFTEFLARVENSDLAAVHPRDLKKILQQVWQSGDHDSIGLAAVRSAEKRPLKRTDLAIITGYLLHFPKHSGSIGILAEAAGNAATRLGNEWRTRGDKWELWNPDAGPRNLGTALACNEQETPRELMESAGIFGGVFATAFGECAFDEACNAVAGMSPGVATTGQQRLLGMFGGQEEDAVSCSPLLVRALLKPWIEMRPDTDHRRAVTEFLLRHAGDPRTDSTRWPGYIRGMAEKDGEDEAQRTAGVLKSWLTEVAMREFFRAIMETTDRKDQWKQRQDFWLGYLDDGYVTDAWFALGTRAKSEIHRIIEKSGEKVDFATLDTRGGADASHSSLIMTLGSMRIAEWSHNGACRFWARDHSRAPALYEPRYRASRLRAMSDGGNFDHISHTSNWQSKFAKYIYRQTNIRHPKHGTAY